MFSAEIFQVCFTNAAIHLINLGYTTRWHYWNWC